jgi:hypothetical protein
MSLALLTSRSMYYVFSCLRETLSRLSAEHSLLCCSPKFCFSSCGNSRAGIRSSALLTCFLIIAAHALNAQATEEHTMQSETAVHNFRRDFDNATYIYCDSKPAFIDVKPPISPLTTKHAVLPNVDIDVIPYARDQRCYRCIEYM